MAHARHLRGLWAILALALVPPEAFACACGCGVFGVGTSSLFPSGSGGQIFAEYDFMDQNQNWSGSSSAPAANNPDKDIRTNFFTVGGQYMFDRRWGVMAEVPYWSRIFKTDPGGGIETFQHAAFGDVRLMGVYTGLSPDMSTGIILGAKLPTGDYKYLNFDRDTEIGSGSTDLLLGAYHLGSLNKANSWSYFAQVMWDRPLASQGGYSPGQEVDAAIGVFYGGFSVAAGKVKIAPVLQFVESARARDGGPDGHPGDSGYSRTIISPGLEINSGAWRLYGDVEIPVVQHLNGNQLAADHLFKVILSRSF